MEAVEVVGPGRLGEIGVRKRGWRTPRAERVQLPAQGAFRRRALNGLKSRGRSGVPGRGEAAAQSPAFQHPETLSYDTPPRPPGVGSNADAALFD